MNAEFWNNMTVGKYLAVQCFLIFFVIGFMVSVHHINSNIFWAARQLSKIDDMKKIEEKVDILWKHRPLNVELNR